MPGATARSRTGRWATTCARPSSRKRSRPAAPTSTAPSIGSAARHRVRGRRAPRRDQGMSEVQGPGPVPRQHPVHYGIGIQALVINLLVAQMLSLRRRARAGDIKLSEASAMLSRCVMGGGRRGAPPATPDVDDFGSTVSGSMSWDPDVQVPAPQARARDRHHPVLQGRPGPRTWASVATSGSHLLRELTFVVEATARLMKSLLPATRSTRAHPKP